MTCSFLLFNISNVERSNDGMIILHCEVAGVENSVTNSLMNDAFLMMK